MKKAIYPVIFLFVINCSKNDDTNDSTNVPDLLVLDQSKDFEKSDMQENDMKVMVIDMTNDMTNQNTCKPSLGTTLDLDKQEIFVVLVKLVEIKTNEIDIIGNGGARTNFNKEFSVAYRADLTDTILTFDSKLSVKLDENNVVKIEGQIARKENDSEILLENISYCVEELGEIANLEFLINNKNKMKVIFSINKIN